MAKPSPFWRWAPAPVAPVLETPKDRGVLLLLTLHCSMGKAWGGGGERTFWDILLPWQQAQAAQVCLEVSEQAGRAMISPGPDSFPCCWRI